MVATIVQFKAGLTGPDMDRLTAAYGLRLDRCLPELSYLERLDAQTVERVRADFLVHACIPLAPAAKLASWIPTDTAPLDLRAALFDDAEVDAVVAALGPIGVRDVHVFDDPSISGRAYVGFALDDPTRLAQIAALDDVALVEPVLEAQPFDVPAAQVFQSGRAGPGADTIWQRDLHGEGQIIGLIDNGSIDLNHCFFNDPQQSRAGANHRKVLAIKNQSNHADDAHFMFVAGIAAGDPLDDKGEGGRDPHRGGAWAAKLVCRNYADMYPPLGFRFLTVLEAARDAGATIHSNSWGEPRAGSAYNDKARDADAFSWDNEDHVVIAAGANSIEANDVNNPPGIAKNVLCVAAAKAFPDQMRRGSGKSGPTPDHRRKPDLLVVGDAITSALLKPKTPPAVYCDTGDRNAPGAELVSTSWATANAAAAAALVRQYFTEGWYPSGTKKQSDAITPTGALIRAVLLNSTVDMTGHPGYPSNIEGWGLIQLDRTLFFFPSSVRSLVAAQKRNGQGLATDQTHRHWIVVHNPAEQLKITLVWTDPPPDPTSASAPVNTIMMTAVDLAGNTYRANDFDINGISQPNTQGAPEGFNNVQMIIVNNPTIGKWVITLQAHVAKGKRQGYALVVAGQVAPGYDGQF
jgi:hypothetical protein